MNCKLCRSKALPYFTGRFGEYHECTGCRAVFLSPENHLNAAEEKTRYETHNNDVEDPGYQSFVRPIVDLVLSTIPNTAKGLDYGCGIGPVISHILGKEGYSIDLYDPIFNNNKSVFTKRYDYIVCCEVFEHFKHPAREFAKLQQMLLPRGKIIGMTLLLGDKEDFETWGYKEDPTHIFFYRQSTIAFIEKQLGFSSSSVADRLVVFEGS